MKKLLLLFTAASLVLSSLHTGVYAGEEMSTMRAYTPPSSPETESLPYYDEYIPLSDEEIQGTQKQAIRFLREEQAIFSNRCLTYRHPYVHRMFTEESQQTPESITENTVYYYARLFHLDIWSPGAPTYIETETLDTVTTLLPARGFERIRSDMLNSICVLAGNLETKYCIQIDGADILQRCNDLYEKLKSMQTSHDRPKNFNIDADVVNFINSYLLYNKLHDLHRPIENNNINYYFLITQERLCTNGESQFHIKLIRSSEIYSS